MLYFDMVQEKAKEYGIEIQRDGTILSKLRRRRIEETYL